MTKIIFQGVDISATAKIVQMFIISFLNMMYFYSV